VAGEERIRPKGLLADRHKSFKPRRKRLSAHCRCEVQPGPQFVLRKYDFKKRGNGSLSFNVAQYHYADRNCRQALYSLEAQGELLVGGGKLEATPFGPAGASLVVPGATQVGVEVRSVSLTPHGLQVAQKLQRR